MRLLITTCLLASLLGLPAAADTPAPRPADATVLTASAGEGVAMPKGWKGHWSTQGCRKYYVVYLGAPERRQRSEQ